MRAYVRGCRCSTVFSSWYRSDLALGCLWGAGEAEGPAFVKDEQVIEAVGHGRYSRAEWPGKNRAGTSKHQQVHLCTNNSTRLYFSFKKLAEGCSPPFMRSAGLERLIAPVFAP